MDKIILGNTLKQRRDLLHISQEELSKLSGVGIKTIYAVEQGKGNPSLEILLKLLEVVGLEFELSIKKGNS
ncbi:MAG TPA: helix-turn-helix domain-containing protein [Cytophagaceae bacterium]|jgi:transcriptional regulator with XRE-family HTH domain|nr:helix-turn-helix domain-containing protein [Cytophagaceae bacterium]